MFQFDDAQEGAENQIGQQIRKLRLEMGLTQEQFAIRLGVSFPTVNRWENQKKACRIRLYLAKPLPYQCRSYWWHQRNDQQYRVGYCGG